ncbi:MAG: hypothetical protein KIT11_05815 [Fimbriimonadaceae bacterium]|nr:hypothetical protein [Fimbriimonadaceae bacterium]QYK55877.1 MAG: hypothetical protein KF733_00005 [Fimbriimonadaceae bacterium]
MAAEVKGKSIEVPFLDRSLAGLLGGFLGGWLVDVLSRATLGPLRMASLSIASGIRPPWIYSPGHWTTLDLAPSSYVLVALTSVASIVVLEFGLRRAFPATAIGLGLLCLVLTATAGYLAYILHLPFWIDFLWNLFERTLALSLACLGAFSVQTLVRRIWY